MMTCTAARFVLPAALAVMALMGCQRALVYGERSGFNLGVSVDTANSRPLDVNIGFKRAIVGVIPGNLEGEDGALPGQAVNMFSRFGLDYAEDEAGPFGGKLTVSTAFASGEAAVEIAKGPEAPSVVAAIVRPIAFRLTDDPEQREVMNALFGYTGQSVDQAQTYLALAAARGLTIPDDGDPNTRAVGTIADPANGAENLHIARFLNLSWGN